MKTIAPGADDSLLLGFNTCDDAAVWQLTPDLAAVLTVDFFTPPVDDPYTFGRIAAANALSDIFAMGATPVLALNLLGISTCLGSEVAADILRGGADAVREAGAVVAGGHTIENAEPTYGLCVFGTVQPERIVRNAGARPGDLLYLTKPLGASIVLAAHRIGLADEAESEVVTRAMSQLNAVASRAMCAAGVHAATDVTGFGLAGHLHEMLVASGCSAALDWDAIPLFPRVWEHALGYCLPTRALENAELAEGYVQQGVLAAEDYDVRLAIMGDPQTSGGLLIALPAEAATEFERLCAEGGLGTCARIGVITEDPAGIISFRS